MGRVIKYEAADGSLHDTKKAQVARDAEITLCKDVEELTKSIGANQTGLDVSLFTDGDGDYGRGNYVLPLDKLGEFLGRNSKVILKILSKKEGKKVV